MRSFLYMQLTCFCLAMVWLDIDLSANVITVAEANQLPNDPRALYVDLMKRCLANTIYEDESSKVNVVDASTNFDANIRKNGLDWPSIAHTMIGMKRLDNIQYCVETVIKDNVPGDLIETGVWRGGATILMRAILKAYKDTRRFVWVADSFEGLPPPNSSKYPADANWDLTKYPELSVSLEKVMENFSKYGLLDNQVIFLKGFFSQTLPQAPIEKIAVLRLDGDLYESTMDALINLYPKLAISGFIIIDDYYAVDACAKAVNDYRAANNINDPIINIDGSGVFWRKSL